MYLSAISCVILLILEVDWFYYCFFTVRYYEGLQKCVGLYSENAQFPPDEIDRLDALYKSLGQEYKWSSAVKVTHFLDLCLFIFPFLQWKYYVLLSLLQTLWWTAILLNFKLSVNCYPIKLCLISEVNINSWKFPFCFFWFCNYVFPLNLFGSIEISQDCQNAALLLVLFKSFDLINIMVRKVVISDDFLLIHFSLTCWMSDLSPNLCVCFYATILESLN